MEPFASVPEQRRGEAAAGGGARRTGARTRFSCTVRPASGSGPRRSRSRGALLGDERRVEARSHPDLYVLEPLGEMIRIDDVRALRHDLHMRPFEADRRVYLVLDADRMNEEAADALLKDLEEPPPYAVIVLVAGELGPLPPTILSRCQLVPFRRLSEARGAGVDRVAGAGAERGGDACPRSRVAAAGSIALDASSTQMRPRRRDALIDTARAVYLDARSNRETPRACSSTWRRRTSRGGA